MKDRTLVETLAGSVEARLNCIQDDKLIWEQKHEAAVEYLVQRFMPSGSGVDSGTQIDLVQSTRSKLVFRTAFHHLNERGFYDGWTEHNVIVRPTFAGIDLHITGRNRNEIKDYLSELFQNALLAAIPEEARVQAYAD